MSRSKSAHFIHASILSALVALSVGCGPTAATLRDAMVESNFDRVKASLAAGVDPNEPVDGMVPLCRALRKDHADGDTLALMLLDAGANPNVSCDLPDDEWGSLEYTALECAATLRRKAVVRALMAHGANLLKSNGQDNLLVRMVRADHHDTEGIAGLYLDEVKRVHGPAKMRELANSAIMAWTPLAKAAYRGDDAMIRQLVARGADPNARVSFRTLAAESERDGDHWPVLYFAELGARRSTADLLIELGADPEALSEKGMDVEYARDTMMESRTIRQERHQAFEDAKRADALDSIRLREQNRREMAAAWNRPRPGERANPTTRPRAGTHAPPAPTQPAGTEPAPESSPGASDPSPAGPHITLSAPAPAAAPRNVHSEPTQSTPAPPTPAPTAQPTREAPPPASTWQRPTNQTAGCTERVVEGSLQSRPKPTREDAERELGSRSN
jgi:hypothetical protein